VHWNPDVNPHLAISAGGGGGKSTALAQVAVELAGAGAELAVVDTKGQNDWSGLEGVTLHRGVETFVAAIAGFRDRMEARYALYGSGGRRRVLLIEDLDDLIHRATRQGLRRDLHEAVTRIAAVGRCTDHHLVVTTHSGVRVRPIAELIELGAFACLALRGAHLAQGRPRIVGAPGQGLFQDCAGERAIRVLRPEPGRQAG
jgi:hypothetical protein